MKNTFIMIAVVTCMVACKKQVKENKSIESTVSKAESLQNCQLRKFRLCARENYFDLSKEEIKLIVPVTDPTLSYAETHNISSPSINAILIHFFGGPECTPDQGQIYPKEIKPPIKFQDIGIRANQIKDSLLVVTFVNDSLLTPSEVNLFKDQIANSGSYKEALDSIRSVPCRKWKEAGFIEPREQDGDVIGGN